MTLNDLIDKQKRQINDTRRLNKDDAIKLCVLIQSELLSFFAMEKIFEKDNLEKARIEIHEDLDKFIDSQFKITI